MNFDEFFTDGDKPYAENLNDSLVLLDAFNLTVPVELPDMFNNGKFGSTVDVSRKAGVSIVTLKSVDNGVTIGTDSISGTGDVVFRVYPNFNSFYKWQSIVLTKTGTVSVAFKTIDGNSISATVNNDGVISEASALKALQPVDVVFTLTSATISKILIKFINNQQNGRTRPNALIDGLHISNVDNELSNSSENVVQNKVIKAALDGKAGTVHSHTESDISDLGDYALSSELADVATSGSYNDLSDKPIIDGAYVHPSTKQCNYAYEHPTTKQCNYAYQHPATKQCNATIPDAYVHPSEKQCSYAYVHPTTKQCNAPISGDGYVHPSEKQCDYEYVHPSTKVCNYNYVHPTTKQCNATIPDAYVHPSTKQCNYSYNHPSTKQCNALIPEAYVHPSSKQCNYEYQHPSAKQCNAVIPEAYVHPSSKQCNYSYNHPSTKQCDYEYVHPASKQCSHTHDGWTELEVRQNASTSSQILSESKCYVNTDLRLCELYFKRTGITMTSSYDSFGVILGNYAPKQRIFAKTSYSTVGAYIEGLNSKVHIYANSSASNTALEFYAMWHY